MRERIYYFYKKKHMRKTILLSAIFIMATLGLWSQNTTTTDTLMKKQQPAHTDTTLKKQAPPPVQQVQPAPKKVKKDNRPLKDRIGLALNTSFWANTHQVLGEASLLVSYKFPRILSVGAGPVYIYNYQRGEQQNLNGWGGKIFARAMFLKFFYLWTEYQGIKSKYLIWKTPVTQGYTIGHEYVDSWFLGAGVIVPLGRRFSINMSVLYDVLHGSSSPYMNATAYRIGFSF